MVVSHERSGTHFLINSLQRAYDFPVGQLINFDQTTLNINYFEPEAVAEVLAKIVEQHPQSIVKSHHPVEFFDEVLDDVLKHLIVFYIHRDPVDVMISFWRYMHLWSWHEGPRSARAAEFAAAEPEGQMLRYQMRQRRNMLDRWAHHVDGWTMRAEGRSRIFVVRYDQLRNNYEKTISGFSGMLGPRTGSLTPPNRRQNVIPGPPADRFERPDRDALRTVAEAEVGDTMRRLGYA